MCYCKVLHRSSLIWQEKYMALVPHGNLPIRLQRIDKDSYVIYTLKLKATYSETLSSFMKFSNAGRSPGYQHKATVECMMV